MLSHAPRVFFAIALCPRQLSKHMPARIGIFDHKSWPYLIPLIPRTYARTYSIHMSSPAVLFRPYYNMPSWRLVWPILGKFAPLWPIRPKIGKIRQVFLYVARYASIVQKPLKMACSVLIWSIRTKYDHLWLCLPRNCQFWATLGKCHRFEFEWHTFTKIDKYALIWPIMEYYGQQCSRMVNYD